MVVGPGWAGETPPGIKKVFRSSTEFSGAIYRTQLFNPADMPNVIRVQSGYKVQPLSGYLHQRAPAAPSTVDFPRIDDRLAKENFFEYLDFALRFAPSGPEEAAIRAKLARIGVGPGKKFDFRDLSAEDKAAIAAGMEDGEKRIEQKLASFGKDINGWRVGSAFGAGISEGQT